MIFPRVVAAEVNRASEVFFHASGKPINVARALHTLGEESLVCVPLGGRTGDICRGDLGKSGIEFEAIETKSTTRTCVTLIDQSRHEATELVQEAEKLSASEIARLKKEFLRALPGAKMALLSGSLAPGVKKDFYADCCAAAGRCGVPVILDARGPEMLRALKDRPLVVKPNRQELSATMDKPLKNRAALKRAMLDLCRQGAKWAIVTMGREGAMVCDGQKFWEIPAIQIDVVSPIGSGDAFAAGLSCAIRRGREIPDACRLATACAAANALIPGAGRLRLADVRKIEKMVRILRMRA